MKRIVFPLKLQMKRSQVEDLHEALALIGLQFSGVEKDSGRFGASTRGAVRKFQLDHSLPVTGIVDEATAQALNGVLADRGAFDEEAPFVVSDGGASDPVVAFRKMDPDVLLDSAGLTPAELAAKVPAVSQALNAVAQVSVAGTVQARLSQKAPATAKILSRIDVAAVLAKPGSASTDLLAKLKKAGATKTILADVARRLDSIDVSKEIDAIVRPALPIGANPLLISVIDGVRLYRLGCLAGVTATTMDKVRARGLAALTLSDRSLEDAIAAGVLTSAESERVACATGLFRLTDQNPDLTAALLTEASPTNTKAQIQSVKELVHWTASDWETRLARIPASCPRGISSADYAASLVNRIGFLFPTDMLMARLATPKAGTLRNQITVLNSVLVSAPGILKQRGVTKATAGVAAVGSHAESLDHLQRIVRTFPGLELGSLAADSARTPGQRASAIVARVGHLRKLYDNNPEIELLQLDYGKASSDTAQLSFAGIPEVERPIVIRTFKAYQRTHRITGDIDRTIKLVEAGYPSAKQIVAKGRSLFQQHTGLNEAETNKYFRKAQTIAAASNAALGTAFDDVKGGFDLLWASNTDRHANQFLKSIDGYAELFGRQDYCRCDHCCSVLSPAAYFVDLMHLVDTQITQPNFSGAFENHELNLMVRRPDLWTLPLTCDNTNDLISQLRIVCEILASFIAKRTSITLHSRNLDKMIEAIAPELATAAHSISQPASLPLRTVEILLAELGTNRPAIARVLGQDTSAVAIAELGLSPEDVYLITTANTTPAYMDQLYGLTFKDASGGVGLVAVDAQTLLGPLGLTRVQLGDLVQTRFVTGKVSEITIAGGTRTADSVQNDVEWVSGLTRLTLDLMLRFTRLWRKLDLPISELDLLLGYLKDAGLSSGLNLSALEKIADTVRLQKDPGLGIEDACAMFGSLPATPLEIGGHSLQDRVFNITGAEGGFLPQEKTVFIHPDFATAPSLSMDVLNLRLQTSLRLDNDGLKDLITGLTRSFNLTLPPTAAKKTIPVLPGSDFKWPGGGIDPRKLLTWEEALRLGFPVTTANLAMLYRHARLAVTLGLSVNELFRMIELVPAIVNNCVASPKDVFALLEFRAWTQRSEILPATLAFATGGLSDEAAEFGDATACAEGVISDIEKDHALFFADTVFAQTGLSEVDSLAIVGANPELFICDGSGSAATYRLAYNSDLAAALTIPAGVTLPAGATNEGLREILLAWHPSTLVPRYLANQLGLNADTVAIYLAMSGGWEPGDPAYFAALRRDKANAGSVFPDLVTAVLRVKALFATLELDLDSLQFIVAHPALFGDGVPCAVELAYVQRLVVYRDLLARIASPFTARDLNDLLCSFQSATQFPASDLALFASLLGTDSATVRAVQSITPAAGNPLDALGTLRVRCELVMATRIEPAVLLQAVSTSITELTPACGGLRRAFALKFPDAADCQKHTTAADDALLAIYCDALVAYILHSLGLPLKNESDLYRHFLIDPQVESYFRTSRVVAAISSVQLYIQRILLNLEQDRMKDVFKLSDSALQGFRKEWDWRQRYRVWEGNRKVFLWPENWLTPDVRDDKTSLYKDFEGQLRQKEIDEPGILELYTNYIQGLQQLAHLKVAGAFHERLDADDGSAGVLHVFATTSDNPPVYFYRSAEIQEPDDKGVVQVIWRSWNKVDLKIPVRAVSPIVYQKKLFVFWCEIVTTQQNLTKDGNSIFGGYTHKLAIKYSCLQADGRWAPPQQLSMLGSYPFELSDGIVEDPLVEPAELAKFISAITNIMFNGTFSGVDLGQAILDLIKPRYDPDTIHSKAIDGYTLRGEEWEWVYPQVDYFDSIQLVASGFQLAGAVDLFDRKVVANSWGTRPLRVPLDWRYSGSPYIFKENARDSLLYFAFGQKRFCGRPAFAQFMADPVMRARLKRSMYLDSDTKGWADCLGNLRATVWGSNGPAGWDQSPLIALPSSAKVRIVNDSASSYTGLTALICDSGGTLLLRYALGACGFSLHRMDSDVPNTFARVLFTKGLDGLLGLDVQKTSESGYLGVQGTPSGVSVVRAEIPTHIDFDGPMGDYYWELYFHIPMTIASLLNSQARYEEARKWFHYVFDPTAIETTATGGNAKDRVWRFLPFRETNQTLRDMLNDGKALAAYKQDPFSPHAIARLRDTAYKKAVVMQYVGNLLDWADSLFAQFQMETVNEAVMLYNLASDILGPRPPELGACSEGSETTRTFFGLNELADSDGCDFLVELEHEAGSATKMSKSVRRKWTASELLAWGRITPRPDIETGMTLTSAATGPKVRTQLVQAHVTTTQESSGTTGGATKIVTTHETTTTASSWKEKVDTLASIDVAAGYQMSLTQVPFCVPMNQNLLALWDRVEDRLSKIRHCLDIDGERRDLALFAPEIDPGLLIRARVEGIPLGDILGALDTRIPPYRFSFLIEKAKQFASTLDYLGNALFSALEKKDGEELNLLRNSHEKNMLLLDKQVREWEADAAANAIVELEARESSVTHRRDYYQQLVDGGLNNEEWTERVSRHVATASRVTEATMDLLAGLLHLIPDVGSPFAMKYGGSSTGSAMGKIAGSLGATAQLCDALASSAGMEANFARREQEWRRQLRQAQDNLAEITKQKKTMELRQRIAERAIVQHEKSVEQNEEIAAFFSGKFTQLGFYIWISKRLREIYRQSFKSAYALAKMVEQAYVFERGEDNATYLNGGYWNPANGGLSAGNALLADLNVLERRYLETNYRDLEITQSISLAQIDPSALASLCNNGTTGDFVIPEYVFDLSYPGHYRRMVKSVRLSIPCVVGPLTNIAANLTLKSSSIRMGSDLSVAPKTVPLGRTCAIATSSANNDGGAFELSFRDERYLPFEGVGAVSRWTLDLPQTFRTFDYSSITDVIIHLSYTAKSSEDLRAKMEGQSELLLKAIQAVVFKRLFSLRHDFPTEYHRLISSPAGTKVELDIDERHFPYFLKGQTLKTGTTAKLGVDVGKDQLLGSLKFQLNNSPIETWASAVQVGGLPACDAYTALGNLVRKHTLKVVDAGKLGPRADVDNSSSTLDPDKLRDILIYCEFKI